MVFHFPVQNFSDGIKYLQSGLLSVLYLTVYHVVALTESALFLFLISTSLIRFISSKCHVAKIMFYFLTISFLNIKSGLIINSNFVKWKSKGSFDFAEALAL